MEDEVRNIIRGRVDMDHEMLLSGHGYHNHEQITTNGTICTKPALSLSLSVSRSLSVSLSLKIGWEMVGYRECERQW